jgi:hypothetical protein
MNPLDWLAESSLQMLFPGLFYGSSRERVAIAAGPWNELLTLADDKEFRSGPTSSSAGAILPRRRGPTTDPACPVASRDARTGCLAVRLQRHIREREDSLRLRSELAAHWQRFANAAYPYDA